MHGRAGGAEVGDRAGHERHPEDVEGEPHRGEQGDVGV